MILTLEPLVLDLLYFLAYDPTLGAKVIFVLSDNLAFLTVFGVRQIVVPGQDGCEV